MRSKQIELLAPAGSVEALRAAVNAGADAVYLAGKMFGARAFADNFSDAELATAIKFAHLHGVSVHVTVNTIVNDEELAALDDYLKLLASLDVDAILVQDLGVAARARELIPSIPLHASTQMTIHNLEGVLAAAEFGFDRAVLARELSLEEIRSIVEQSPIEIEVFAHGALCVCTSGQCLMSSMIGARSGNRGRCAQPCRLPYDLIDSDGSIANAGKYILSPKDLNSLERLDELISSGVTSLKIEGRMKRAEYVAIVVETYRRAIDRCLEQKRFEPTVEERRRLAQIFNRDFTTAYLDGRIDRTMISDKKPNNRGLPIGRVVSIDGRTLEIKTLETINVGDQLEIWVKVGGRINFTVEALERRGDSIRLSIENVKGVRVHDRVFKIFDAELAAHAQKIFEPSSNKIPLDAEVLARLDRPLSLKFVDAEGNVGAAQTKTAALRAEKNPLTPELVEKKIGRLGSTEFVLDRLTADLDGNLLVPISELNDVRRRAIEQLEAARLKKFSKPPRASVSIASLDRKRASARELIVAVDSIEKINLLDGADGVLFGGDSFRHQSISNDEHVRAIELVHSLGLKIYIGTPRLVRNSEQSALEKILGSIGNADGVYVHNIGALRLARRLTRLPLFTDFSLIAFNSTTLKFLSGLGVEGVTLSPELTLNQIRALRSPLPLECIVGGRAELMIMFYCPIGSFAGCNRICERKKFFLRDRMNAEFPIVTDQFCRAHILNGKVLSMADRLDELRSIDRLRIDGRAMSDDELRSTVKKFRAALDGRSVAEEGAEFTRGHYFRGV